MNLYLALILSILQFTLFSQRNTLAAGMNYTCSWENISLNKNYVPTINDTCLFVVSTRNYDESKKEFLDYDFDTTNTLRYFVLYYKGNNWVAVPFSSLDDMLNTKESLKNLVVFTEGLGKTFTKGIDRATKLMRLYSVDEVFFDWPTSRPYIKKRKNVKVTYRVSSKVTKPYAKFLQEFADYKNTHLNKFKIVTLLNHSMGNLLLAHGLNQNLLSALPPNLADNVILNASCVNQRKHKLWLNKLEFSKNIFVTINNHDKHLRIARILFGAKQLGVTTKYKDLKNTHYIDFSNVLKGEHNYFLMKPLFNEKPFLQKFYADVFEGKQPQLKFLKSELINSKTE